MLGNDTEAAQACAHDVVEHIYNYLIVCDKLEFYSKLGLFAWVQELLLSELATLL